jgi:2-methylaconitate cis-trans-isomerase PrpF
MTGRILPSGSARDTLFIPQPQTGPSGDLVLKTLAVPVSMVDAANPFVFVHAASLGLEGNETADQLAGATPLVQLIRAHASIAMGIASTLAEAMAMQGCPKIALVAPPQSFVSSAGQSIDASRTDINSRAYSMGLPHPNLQITGAVCLAAAASIPGTIPHDIVKAARSRVPPVTTTDKHNQPEHIEDVSVLTFSKLVISHLGGTIMADSDVVRNPLLPGGVDIRSGSVYRTARRLMEGKAYYHTLSSPPVAAIMSVSASVKVPTNLLLGMDRGSYAVSAQ